MDWKPLTRILLIGVLYCLFLGVWMWAVRQVFPGNPANITPDLYKGVPVESHAWLEPWQRWDTPHYQAIAERGYAAFENALFTPPLFPWLMRLGAPLFGGNTLASGLFVSGLAFLGCLAAFVQTAHFELGSDREASRALLYLLSFPTAFFLVAAYSESLFLLGAILSLYNARRKRWVAAGLWAALAALARIPGTFLVFPLGYAAWQAWREGQRSGLLAPLLAGLGAGVYPLYDWLILRQSPFAILTAQYARGGSLSLPGWNMVEAVIRIFRRQLVAENLIELSFTVLLILMAVMIWKKLPRIYGVYTLTLMLLFLTRIGSPQPLVGMARYGLEIFPTFFVLALLGRNVRVNRFILYLSWPGLLFFSAQFAMWGWVG